MKKTLISIIFSLFLALSITGCYYDNEEALYGKVSCDTTNVTFSATIDPILQQNCVICHSTANPQGNVALDNYANDTIWAANGRLKGSIEHASGFSPMPKNGSPLDDCSIAKINIWIAHGYPNN